MSFSLADIHLALACCSVAMVLLSDQYGARWMRGRVHTLDRRIVSRLHLLVWIGLVALVVTGGLLFWRAPAYYLSQPLFMLKVLFVAVLILNGVLIGRLMHVAVEKPYAALSYSELLPLFVSGAVSMLGWFSVLGLGLYLFW